MPKHWIFAILISFFPSQKFNTNFLIYILQQFVVLHSCQDDFSLVSTYYDHIRQIRCWCMIGTLKHIYHLVVQSSLSQINFNCKFKLNFLLVQQPPACNDNTQSDSLGLAYLPWVGRSVGGGRLLSTCWLASGDDNGNNEQQSSSGRVSFPRVNVHCRPFVSQCLLRRRFP